MSSDDKKKSDEQIAAVANELKKRLRALDAGTQAPSTTSHPATPPRPPSTLSSGTPRPPPRKQWSSLWTAGLVFIFLAGTFTVLVTRSQPGSLSVTTDPAGAQVFVDDKEMGLSPLQVPSVEPGSHVVRATHAEYRPTRTNVTVAAGEETAVTMPLTRSSPPPPPPPPAPPPTPAPPPAPACGREGISCGDDSDCCGWCVEGTCRQICLSNDSCATKCCASVQHGNHGLINSACMDKSFCQASPPPQPPPPPPDPPPAPSTLSPTRQCQKGGTTCSDSNDCCGYCIETDHLCHDSCSANSDCNGHCCAETKEGHHVCMAESFCAPAPAPVAPECKKGEPPVPTALSVAARVSRKITSATTSVRPPRNARARSARRPTWDTVSAWRAPRTSTAPAWTSAGEGSVWRRDDRMSPGWRAGHALKTSGNGIAVWGG
jgi:hypothetical protein